MKDLIIIISANDVLAEARLATWKTGRVYPQDDGLHGEKQISIEEKDTRIVMQLASEALGSLAEVCKDFDPVTSITDDEGEETAQPDISSTFSMTLNVTKRCTATAVTATPLAREYIVAHVVGAWYGMVRPDHRKEWDARKNEAEARLSSLLHHKSKPVI